MVRIIRNAKWIWMACSNADHVPRHTHWLSRWLRTGWITISFRCILLIQSFGSQQEMNSLMSHLIPSGVLFLSDDLILLWELKKKPQPLNIFNLNGAFFSPRIGSSSDVCSDQMRDWVTQTNAAKERTRVIGIIGVETVTSTFTLYRRFLVVNYLLIRMLNRKNSRTSKPSTTITKRRSKKRATKSQRKTKRKKKMEG